MTSDLHVYCVTVAFRQGYGESFARLDVALTYAETQMNELLTEHEHLENEEFEGIYCERNGLVQYWRFDYVAGAAVWVPLLDNEKMFAARVGAIRQGAALVVTCDPEGPSSQRA